jgi:cytochrome c oxidase subunit 4
MAHRDDLIVNDAYALHAQHGEEEGKKVRSKIWKVTALLSIVTFIEVMMGVFIKQTSEAWHYAKWTFIALTILKAGYIVMVFMHLGEEKKNLRRFILYIYYVLIIYLVAILTIEAVKQNHKLTELFF